MTKDREELVEKVKVLADKLTYSMDNGLEEIAANQIIDLKEQYNRNAVLDEAIERCENVIFVNSNESDDYYKGIYAAIEAIESKKVK